MNDDLKSQIDLKQKQCGFIKVTEKNSELTDVQKVALIRKANQLFNEGKTDLAERIFITTGYSDGLTRIGDKYAEKNEYLEALRMYELAHNKRKSEPLIEKIAGVISVVLKE